jgi:type II secretory pathway pseudopilin PulG
MLGTLRFRLTALFLIVVLVFGLVSIALAVRLFQDVTRSQSVRELRREAAGLAELYGEAALRASDAGSKAPEFAAENLEAASGNELFYVGPSIFPGQRFGLGSSSRRQAASTSSSPPRSRFASPRGRIRSAISSSGSRSRSSVSSG